MVEHANVMESGPGERTGGLDRNTREVVQDASTGMAVQPPAEAQLSSIWCTSESEASQPHRSLMNSTLLASERENWCSLLVESGPPDLKTVWPTLADGSVRTIEEKSALLGNDARMASVARWSAMVAVVVEEAAEAMCAQWRTCSGTVLADSLALGWSQLWSCHWVSSLEAVSSCDLLRLPPSLSLRTSRLSCRASLHAAATVRLLADCLPFHSGDHSRSYSAPILRH